MKASVVVWVLLALCGAALVIFAADGVVKVIGGLLVIVGVLGVAQARRRAVK